MRGTTTELTRVSAADYEELIAKAESFLAESASMNDEAIEALTGIDATELQGFLEDRAGVNPDEEAQGSVMAAAVSIVMHC
jgi:hypothetical protein